LPATTGSTAGHDPGKIVGFFLWRPSLAAAKHNMPYFI